MVSQRPFATSPTAAMLSTSIQAINSNILVSEGDAITTNEGARPMLDNKIIELLSVAKALCGCTDTYNSAQWENPWYLHWSTALASLFSSPDTFTAPQFPVYYRPTDDDREMVVPDFCVLYLTGDKHLCTDSDPSYATVMDNYLRSNWVVEDISFLILAEIKRNKIIMNDCSIDSIEDIPAAVDEYYQTCVGQAKGQAIN